MLKAMHVRCEQILALLSNQLSIIRASCEHSKDHAAVLQGRLYGVRATPLYTPDAQSELQKILD